MKTFSDLEAILVYKSIQNLCFCYIPHMLSKRLWFGGDAEWNKEQWFKLQAGRLLLIPMDTDYLQELWMIFQLFLLLLLYEKYT